MRRALIDWRLANLAAVALLSACAAAPRGGGGTSTDVAPAPTVNLSGYSAAFKQGYAQGCDSARRAQQRDAQRYGADADYTMGWNDGYSICRRR